MSQLPFELFLAVRYLRPKRTFVSVITLISIIGVMLGVAVLIVVISVMSGFDRQLRDRILGFKAHLTVLSDAPMTNHFEILNLISSNGHVKGTAPYVMGQVLARTQPTDGSPPLVICPVIRGIDAQLEEQVSVLPRSIVSGKFDVSGNRVLVGQEFARKMNVEVGDTLAIYSIRDFERLDDLIKQARENDAVDEGFLPTDYEISGIFDVGYYEFNDLFVVCSLGNAQDLYGLEDAVQGLQVMLHDPLLARQVQSELRDVLGNHYGLITWEQENSEILDALLVEKNVMFYLLFFIMIVAAFGITSALITFVVQKTREIGILKALGASSRQIMAIFLSQSLLVGVLGVTAGYGLGMLAVTYRNEFLIFLRRATSFELFPARIYGFSELPALITSSDIALICGVSLVICILAGVFPAWNAGRLKPVEALRYE